MRQEDWGGAGTVRGGMEAEEGAADIKAEDMGGSA